MTSQKKSETLALITCSYGPDFDRCKRLCGTIDRWIDPGHEHVLIVPKSDLPLFSPLSSKRRRIVSVEDTVPGKFIQLPFTKKWWIGYLAWPTRGWVMQQITKLSAGFVTTAENLIFVDSDIQFIRPLNPEMVLKSDKLRLHSMPGEQNTGVHLKWHLKAGELLGCEQSYAGADYVGQLVTWRRSVLLEMLEQITKTVKKPWYRAVAQSLTVSEYILYGMYVSRVRGTDTAGHFESTIDICHCCWDQKAVDAIEAGKAQLKKHEIAVLIQSNLGYSDAEEMSLFNKICQLAEQQA